MVRDWGVTIELWLKYRREKIKDPHAYSYRENFKNILNLGPMFSLGTALKDGGADKKASSVQTIIYPRKIRVILFKLKDRLILAPKLGNYRIIFQ